MDESDEAVSSCLICAGADGDAALHRVGVWEDDLWRLSVSLSSEVPGFSYLEPKRHIPHITDLDGPEATTLGSVLARLTRVLRAVTGAEVVFIYVFGDGIPHLHLHLAPHREGDALNSSILRGETVIREGAGGAGLIESAQFPPLPESELRAVASEVSRRLHQGNI